ncbi:hypothetical protein RvVAR0630_pl05380 (plasmid) [Agrobacterium vitis]|nr:hypothetical protein RvVAR0630_pl05380 [Agrobacterium vitis]
MTALFATSVAAKQPAIKLDAEWTVKYRSLTANQQSKADRLFYLSVADPASKLPRALEVGAQISTDFGNNIKQYRASLQTSWYRTYLRSSRVMHIPPVPDKPELIQEGDWKYDTYVRRAMEEEFNVDDTRAGNKKFLNALDFAFGQTKPMGFMTRLGKRLFQEDEGTKLDLVDRRAAMQAYQSAISALLAATDDERFSRAVDELIETRYGDRTSLLQLIDEMKPSELPDDQEAMLSELRSRQSAALERLRHDYKKEEEEKAGGSPPPEPEHTVDWYLSEWEGGARVLLGVLSFQRPELANKLATYNKAALDLAHLWNAYQTNQIGPLALSGNYLGIMTTLLSAQQQATEQERISEGFQELSKSIAELRQVTITGFQALDDRITELSNLLISGQTETSKKLDTLTNLAMQTYGQVVNVNRNTTREHIVEAHAQFVQQRREIIDSTASVCFFVTDSTKCIDNILKSLLIASRTTNDNIVERLNKASEALYVSELPVDVTDGLLAVELWKNSGSPQQRTANIAGTNEKIPAGSPDLGMWLALLEELRFQHEVKKLPFTKAEIAALQEVLRDGRAFKESLESLGRSVPVLWKDYLVSADALRQQVASVVSEYSEVESTGGLRGNSWHLCYIFHENKPCDAANDQTLTDEQLLAPIEQVGEGVRLSKAFDDFEQAYVQTIGPTPGAVVRRNDVWKGDEKPYYFVEYASLPESFRNLLRVGDIERLQKLGFLRLVGVVQNVKWTGGVHSLDEDIDCGAIRPSPFGSRCSSYGRFFADVTVKALLRPPVTKADIEKLLPDIKDAKFKQKILNDMQWAWSVAESRSSSTYELASFSIDTAAPIPVKVDGNSIRVDNRMSDAAMLAYVHQGLAEADKIQPGATLSLLRSQEAEIIERRVDITYDLLRSLLHTDIGDGAVPFSSAVADSRISVINSLAKQAQSAFNRWIFASSLNDRNDWTVENLVKLCSLKPQNILKLLKSRTIYEDRSLEWLFADFNTNDCSTDVLARLHGGGTGAPEVLKTVMAWNAWLAAIAPTTR